jgi:hypothetical protein
VKQPEAGYLFSSAALIPSYSAIMRGAVLYKLGVDVVRERVMRMSYGIEVDSYFRAGYHPGSRWYMNINGLPYCRGVMEWFALKVCFRLISLSDAQGQRLAAGSIIERSFELHYLSQTYFASGPLPWSCPLLVCNDTTPPEYENEQSSILPSIF